MLHYHAPKLSDPRVLLVSYNNPELDVYDKIFDVWEQLNRFDHENVFQNRLEIIESDEELWSKAQGFPSEFGQKMLDKLNDFDVAIFDLSEKHYGFSVEVSVLLYRTTHAIDCSIFVYHQDQVYFLDSKSTCDLYGEHKASKQDFDDEIEDDLFQDEHLQQEYVVEESQQVLL